MKLRFFIVGLGSMGKRRIRNLHVNGEDNIVGFDIRSDRREEARTKYNIKIVVDLKDIAPADFDVLIISTSPEAHGDYIRFALAHKKHFFIEHPTSIDGYDDIIKNKNLAIVKAPSCTLRFYTPIKMMKKLLNEGAVGKVLAFQYHMGQYLPDWHPWEDYRQVYFSKKETSACREMLPFELIWLTWLMGASVKDISGTIAKVSDLDMDADDIILASTKLANGILGNLVIDVISRKPFRTLRVLGSTGVLEWERFDHEIKIFRADIKTEEIISVPKGNPESGYVNEEEMYNDEIKVFLDAIVGRAVYPFTFEENLLNVKALFQLIKNI
ncbi:MAG: Gfo/Idh/MocA family oxidoreductase [Candidatus Magasanikbacteria bacterium]|nr:Gfo/Idh/MocA family oxidoreductase [Candidatus Magasanikbacteria bacterium]